MHTCLEWVLEEGKKVGYIMELSEEGLYSSSNYDPTTNSREWAKKGTIEEKGDFQLTKQPIKEFPGKEEEISYIDSSRTSSRFLVKYEGKLYGHVDELKNKKFVHPHRFHEFDSKEEAAKDLLNICSPVVYQLTKDNVVVAEKKQ